MARSGSNMVRNVREYLHDAGRGFATSNLYYEDDAILLALNDAKRRVAKALILRPGADRKPNPAYVTLCRLQKTTTATTGSAVPEDFWKLEAGLDANSCYIPRVNIGIGEAMVGTGHDLVFVKSGFFYGTAVTALYWAYPTEAVTTSETALTEFPDGLYDTIELLATREMLAQEQSDNADRWKFFGDLFMESLQSFD